MGEQEGEGGVMPSANWQGPKFVARYECKVCDWVHEPFTPVFNPNGTRDDDDRVISSANIAAQKITDEHARSHRVRHAGC